MKLTTPGFVLSLRSDSTNEHWVNANVGTIASQFHEHLCRAWAFGDLEKANLVDSGARPTTSTEDLRYCFTLELALPETMSDG